MSIARLFALCLLAADGAAPVGLAASVRTDGGGASGRACAGEAGQ